MNENKDNISYEELLKSINSAIEESEKEESSGISDEMVEALKKAEAERESAESAENGGNTEIKADVPKTEEPEAKENSSDDIIEQIKAAEQKREAEENAVSGDTEESVKPDVDDLLAKTIEIPSFSGRHKHSSVDENYRKKITDTFARLKLHNAYKDAMPKHMSGDILVDQMNIARHISDMEAEKSKAPTATEDAMKAATAEFTVKDKLGKEGDAALADAFGDTADIPHFETSDDSYILDKNPESEKPSHKKQSEPFFKKAKKFAAAVSASAEKSSEKRIVTDEYTSFEQNKKFLSGFKKENDSLVTRILLTAVLSIILFYIDLVPVVSFIKLPSFLMPPEFNVIYTLVQMQLLLFLMLVNWKGIARGFASLMRWRPDPYAITLTASVAVIIHDIVTMLTCSKANCVCVYNSVCAVSFITGLAYEFMNFKTRLSSFRVSSGKSAKYVISELNGKSSEAEVFSDYADDMRGDMYCVSKTKFTSGVMNKIYAPAKIERYTKFAIAASLALSVIFFIVAVKDGGSTGYHAFTLCLMLSLPVSMFMSAAYPAAHAQSMLEQYGTAILGADSADTLAKAGVMSFNDGDVFPSTGIKVNNIYIYGNNRIDHVIYYAAGAFAKLGGPLNDVFSSADEDGAGACSDIRIIQIAQNGFTMLADGKIVTMGKATYLREKGYLTETTESDAAYESKSGRIMYMAFDNSIAAKFYIKYTMDPEFEVLLTKADSIGVYIGIRTFDPNIDDSLLAQSLNLKKYPVKVVKLKEFDSVVTETEVCDCPAVSRGSRGGSKALLSAMMLSNRIKQLKKILLVATGISMLAAALIMFLLLHAGTFTSTYAFYPIMFQLLFTAISACISNLYLK